MHRPSGDDDFFRFLVENSPDGHFILLQGGNFAFLNEAAMTMFGLDPQVSVELHLADILDPSESERSKRNMALRLRGVLKGAASYLAKRFDGSTFPVEVHARPMEFEGEQAVHGVIRDVTARRKMEQRLESMERSHLVSRLASGIAHDLNNLLAVIQSNTEVAQKESRTNPMALAALRRIHSAVQRGSAKVTHIRQMGGGGAARTEFGAIYVNPIVEEVIDLTRARWQDEAEAAGVIYDVQWQPGSVPTVDGCAADLRAALVALVFNALEAMPRGGCLSLASSVDESGSAVVTIKDTGEGTAGSSLPQLTDAFFTTRTDRQMGLGLHLVQDILARHGGRLDMSSSEEPGSQFSMFLPAGSETPAGPEPAARPEVLARSYEATAPERLRPKTRGGRSVLLIDDQADLVQVVETILESRGFSVDCALNAKDGLALASASKYSIVLTDLGMPDLSGWEVSQQVHALQPKTPVVLMTGWAAEIDSERLAENHVAALLAKPFHGEQLLAVIDKLLRAKEKRRKAEQLST